MKILALTLITGIIAACGTEQTSSTSETSSIIKGEYVMLASPNQDATGCDDFSKIVLRNNVAGATISLRDGLHGDCKKLVPLNDRSYKLSVQDLDCGSKLYIHSPLGEHTNSRIRVTDHRARTCKDVIRAQIVVEEIKQNGSSIILYSDDLNLHADAADLLGQF